MSVDQDRCRHDGFLFGSDAELVAATTPFVSAGLSAGDVVIVHAPDHDLAVLRDAFDGDPRIRFEPQPDFRRSTMGVLAGLQRICDRECAGGRRVRVTGPVPLGDDPLARRQWMQYEALIARVFAPYRFSGLCPYDVRVTPPDLLALARRTHTLLTAAGEPAPDGTADGASAVDADLLRSLAEPPADAADRPGLRTVLPVGRVDDLRAVRHALIRAVGPHARQPLVDNLVTAVNEVVTNALQHGRPPVTLGLRRDGRGWVATVTDHGSGIADPYLGVDSPLPGNPQAPGMGLWLARQLADRLTIGTDGSGATVVALAFDED